MNVLLDTNILTRSSQPGHPQNRPALDSIHKLLAHGDSLNIVPQVIYEFWSVATRPLGENGLNMTPADAHAKVDELLSAFDLIADTSAIFDRWRALVSQHEVKGRPSHDARLVAAMDVHGISTLLTFNRGDFARYSHVTVLTPEQVVTA